MKSGQVKRIVSATLVAAFALGFVAATTPTQAEMILDGQTVRTEFGQYQAHGTADIILTRDDVVGPGTEITNFGIWDSVDIDFSDTNIRLTNRGTGHAFIAWLRFIDVHGTIPRFTSATLNSASNWIGIDQSHISVSPNWITVNLPVGAEAGRQLSFDLTAIVPEPASGGLLLAGIVLLVIGPRRIFRQVPALERCFGEFSPRRGLCPRQCVATDKI